MSAKIYAASDLFLMPSRQSLVVVTTYLNAFMVQFLLFTALVDCVIRLFHLQVLKEMDLHLKVSKLAI